MHFKTIGIIGAGTMGSGIATNLAPTNRNIILIDHDVQAAEYGKGLAAKFYKKSVEKGKMTLEAADIACNNITTSDDLSLLSQCDLVIEAIFEEFEVKKNLLQCLDGQIGKDCLVATNTSALTVSGLAEHISRPERFLGLHYFNPATVNPIVEVVKGAKTDPELYQAALAFIEETGKLPIACKDAYGFAINRFFVPYGNEAVRILDEKLGSIAQIDAMAKQVLNVAAGPFQVMNLVKPKIMYHAQRNLSPHGDFYRLASGLDAIGDKDYHYDLEDNSHQQPANDELIGERLQIACFYPILQALDEEVAKPAAFDLGAKQALKFGIGPCELMDRLGKDKVQAMLEKHLVSYDVAPVRSLAQVGNLI